MLDIAQGYSGFVADYFAERKDRSLLNWVLGRRKVSNALAPKTSKGLSQATRDRTT